MRPFCRSSAALATILSACTAQAADVEVDVELFLAVDVSRSMTPRELEIQRRGYAEALVSEPVLRAIKQGLIGRIAVTYVEWAGTYSQRTIVDWTVLSNDGEAQAFASRLTAKFNSGLRRTSISGVLDYASGAFDNNGFTSPRRVIDISGDGPNNQGRPVLEARKAALAKGLVINGLPLMTREGLGAQWHLDRLDDYYRNCVTGGPASFVIPVYEWAGFSKAVRQKLVLELAGRRPQAPPIIPVTGEQTYDCLIGEKIWQRLRQDWFRWQP